MKLKSHFLIFILGVVTMTVRPFDAQAIQPKTNDNSFNIEISVNANLDEAWDSWIRPNELESWLTEKVRIEPKVDGLYELFWEPDFPERNSTIGCRIAIFELNHHLSFQWKGPVPFANIMNQDPLPTSVSVSFVSESAGTSLIRLGHSGWGSGKDWEKAREWQKNAWSNALLRLKEKFERRVTRLTAPL